MQVILTEDIKGVGKKGDLINASEGHARNYLLPRGLAVEATKGNINAKQKKDEKAEAERKQIQQEAQDLADSIKDKEIIIHVKLGNNGKLFGAVTNKEVHDELKKQLGVDIDKKKITLKSSVKNLGTFEATIKLHPKVSTEVTVKVVEA